MPSKIKRTTYHDGQQFITILLSDKFSYPCKHPRVIQDRDEAIKLGAKIKMPGRA